MKSRENDSPGSDQDVAGELSLPAGPDELHTIGPDHQTFAALARWVPEYGDFFCVQSRDRRDPSFVVSNPEYLKHILLTNHENYAKGVGFERVKMLLGNGIIVSDGDEWRRQRTMMQPGFSRANIARLAEPMRTLNLELRGQWALLADAEQTLDITTAMSRLGLEVILRSILSSDLDRLVERESGNPFAFLAEDSTRDIQTAVRFRNLARLILEIVAERRTTGERPFDFLSLLMDARDRKSGTGMTDKELLDEVNTLIIAGHETSAGTLNWVWYLLSQHPDVEARLLAELAEATPGDGFTFDQLMGLNYAACVLKETLRLYPPVWLFSRRAIKEDRLGEFRVPAGAHVFIAPYFLHRRPELWPDPERFDPDRFDESRSLPVDRYAFMPFSAGARRCIGDYFSFVEMQMHLALLAPRFALRFQPDSAPGSNRLIGLDPAVNLRTSHSIHLTVRHRNAT
jgi:cytochrome P450